MTRATEPQTVDITVVVTCYNHQGFVEQCLESIAAQTRRPVQVIIIDDYSTDNSAWVIEQWLAQSAEPWQFIRHPANRGLCATLNEALDLVEGRYFCHVSSDDWQAADRLQHQFDVFEAASAETALVIGDIREVDAGGGTIVDHDFGLRLGSLAIPENHAEVLPRLLEENVIPAPGVMLRTAAARAVGGYDEELFFEDYDMWMRLATDYTIAYAPGIVANYRVIVGSGMFRNPKRRVAFLRSEAAMLAKHIGSSSVNNATIARRLIPIAGSLIELEATSAVRDVLGWAYAASPDPWLAKALRTVQLPGGLGRLERAYSDRFGLDLRPTA